MASSFVTIFPPVALASFSISDFFALRMAIIPFLDRKCCAMSSMPFWQMTTVAPAFMIFSAMSFSITSSWSRNASIWSGVSMLIFASNSVFSISKEASRSAIFAFSTRFGMPECTISLSRTIPFIKLVSLRDSPVFFSTFTSSTSTLILSPSFSAICSIALTAISAKISL